MRIKLKENLKSNKDFIIEDGKVIAYVGDSNVKEITIPDGVTIIGQCIFQERMVAGITLNIASSVKIIADFAFCVKGGYKKENNILRFNDGGRVCFSKVNIPKDSQLQKIGDFALFGKTDELFIPKTLISVGKFDSYDKQNNHDFDVKKLLFDDECNLQEIEYLPSENFLRIPKGLKDSKYVTSNFIVTVPKDFVKYNKISAPYVFFEREILEDEHLNINAEFVLENVDIDNIKFVNKLNECGYAYIDTSKGLILTKLNNEIAKLNDIPTEIDGNPVWCNNLINPLNIDDNKEKENLGDLYAKIKYEANKKKDKIFNAINIVKPEITKQNYSRFCIGVIGEKAKSNYIETNDVGSLIGGILGLILGLILLYNVPKLNFVVPILGAILGVIIGLIICRKLSRSISRSKDLYRKLKELVQKGMVEELYFHTTLLALNEFVKESYNDAKWAAERDAEWAVFWDRYHNGTAEEQRQKRIESKLSELNKNLRESNNSSSYDVYTNDGEHIGRIDKK